MARTYERRAPLRAGGRGTQKTRRPEPKKKSSWLFGGSTEKSGSAACARCQSKRGMSFQSCALQMRMLCHGLLQMGSRHAPACPQQAGGRHGRRSALTSVPASVGSMRSRHAGTGTPLWMCGRAAARPAGQHPSPCDGAGAPSSFGSGKAAAEEAAALHRA